jgi:hypothetical protein
MEMETKVELSVTNELVTENVKNDLNGDTPHTLNVTSEPESDYKIISTFDLYLKHMTDVRKKDGSYEIFPEESTASLSNDKFIGKLWEYIKIHEALEYCKWLIKGFLMKPKLTTKSEEAKVIKYLIETPVGKLSIFSETTDLSTILEDPKVLEEIINATDLFKPTTEDIYLQIKKRHRKCGEKLANYLKEVALDYDSIMKLIQGNLEKGEELTYTHSIIAQKIYNRIFNELYVLSTDKLLILPVEFKKLLSIIAAHRDEELKKAELVSEKKK